MIYIYIYTSICIIVTAKKIEPYFQGLYRRCCFCTISYYFPHIHAPILHQTSEYLRDDEVARQHIGYGFHDLGIWWNSDAVSDAWRCQKWTTCEDILRNYLLSTTDYNSILIYIYIILISYDIIYGIHNLPEIKLQSTWASICSSHFTIAAVWANTIDKSIISIIVCREFRANLCKFRKYIWKHIN